MRFVDLVGLEISVNSNTHGVSWFRRLCGV